MQVNITLKHPLHGIFESDAIELNDTQMVELNEKIQMVMINEKAYMSIAIKGNDVYFGRKVISESVITVNQTK